MQPSRINGLGIDNGCFGLSSVYLYGVFEDQFLLLIFISYLVYVKCWIKIMDLSGNLESLCDVHVSNEKERCFLLTYVISKGLWLWLYLSYFR